MNLTGTSITTEDSNWALLPKSCAFESLKYRSQFQGVLISFWKKNYRYVCPFILIFLPIRGSIRPKAPWSIFGSFVHPLLDMKALPGKSTSLEKEQNLLNSTSTVSLGCKMHYSYTVLSRLSNPISQKHIPVVSFNDVSSCLSRSSFISEIVL